MRQYLALFAIPLLAACASTSADHVDPAPEFASAPKEVRLALLPPSREGDSALALGVLTVDGPCLYLVGSDGTRRLPGFMTFDTRWKNGALVVGDQRFVPGQRVALGGGEVKGAVANMAWVQAPDSSCDTSLIWVTVSVAPA